jgi:pyruvate dehydrogenase E2 component (dihydrolipoamide acetyltransferase)
MSIDFKLPELGENITSGDVVNVLVEQGQQIEANQGVCELETDKAVIEIPCPQAGRVEKVHIKKGDTVKVGQTLITLGTAAQPAAEPPTPETRPSARLVEPKPGLAAGPEPGPAPEAATPPPVPSPATTAAPAIDRPTPTAGPIPAGPAARRLARELGVDLDRIQGTGTHGRITPEDIQTAATQAKAAPAPALPPAAAPAERVVSIEPVVPPGEPAQDAWGPIRRERMSKIRKTIAAQMSRSWNTVPHVTNFDDADITDLELLRKGVPKGWLGANLKLTSIPFVMKAVAIALRRHPMLNANVDDANEQIIYKEYVHLGVAVDTPRGLVVPVVRNVDRMSIAEIARAVASVAERARAVQFGIEDLRGGTFTISNLGAVGGTYSTPIINYPEVAILLLGRARWLPVVRDGEVEPRFMLPLSLSYDHRLVDGATAARFLNEVIDHLQAPARLMLTQ